MRKFKVFKCSVWENLPNEPLIATHSLGQICWGMREDDHSFHHMCAMLTVATASGNFAQEILQLVADQHRISTEECAEYMPLIMHDISRYYKDQLVLQPDHEDMHMSKDDEEVLAFYEDNLTEINDQRGQRRIQLPLPWKKSFPVSIPQSLETARRRVQAQRKRLVQQPERAQKCEDTFQQMKTEGHAEIVPLDLSEEGENPVHYITHFVTPQEKFRVVYNGALKIDGMSLNDMLHQGPMFIASLVRILLRFRQYACAVIGDIRNMFFQIGLDPKDRDMLRFLPFTKGSSCNASNQWRFKVMPYGLICVPSIAGYCIKYTAKKKYSNASVHTVERVKRDFYVDDFITSVPNVGHAQRVVKETIDLMETTGFVVTKFSSNCKEVLDDFRSRLLSTITKKYKSVKGRSA